MRWQHALLAVCSTTAQILTNCKAVLALDSFPSWQLLEGLLWVGSAPKGKLGLFCTQTEPASYHWGMFTTPAFVATCADQHAQSQT